MKRRTGLAAFAPALLAICLGSGRASAQPGPAPQLALHFIDVGQGDGTLIVCPNDSTVLIDSGSLPFRAATSTRVRNYVRSQILPLGGDIDYLILSHPDADHYNLLRAVLAGVPIGRAYYVGARTDYGDPTIVDWITRTPRTSTRLTSADYDRQATPNPDIDCGAADVWILAADVQSPVSPSNAKSIVVMVRMGDFEAVITGDATHATENAIMSRYTRAWLDVDLLRVGHHGSLATSTSKPWADVLTPLTAIFSAGHTNGYGHPRTEVAARLVSHAANTAPHTFRDARSLGSGRYRWTTYPAYRKGLYATATSGTIVVRTSGIGYSVTPDH